MIEETYSVFRFYSDRREKELVEEGLTRKEAQEYCSYDETEGTLPDGVQWFCGFEKE